MPRSHAYLPGLVAVAVAALACGGDSLSPPSTGTLEVTTSTAGLDPDQDGYTVQLDAEPAQPIGSAATVRTTDITPGNHTVQLAGIAANCAVAEENPRTISVSAGETTTVSFTVSCTATTGSLQLSSSSSGPSPDADGYTITLDGTERGTLGTSGVVRVDALPAGDHLVGLSGVAGNCGVQGDNPRTVTVTAGQSAEVTFTVTCSTPPTNTGTLRIAAATTGPDPDPDGYTFAVDGGATQPIGLNATATLTNMSVGAHRIRLSGLAENCSVDGANPREVAITAGETATVSFAVRCTTASATYRAIDLGTLGGSYSSAKAINLTGQVVGSSGMPGGDPKDGPPNAHAFLWEKGVMTDLGTLGGGYSSAEDINDAGQVVGFSVTGSGVTHAFFWDKGVMTDLGSLGGDVSDAMGVNTAGQVVGTSYTPIQPITGGQPRAYLWEKGVMTDLGTLGGSSSFAADINDQGQVVGHSTIPGPDHDYHAFLWEKGVMIDLGTLGPNRSEATGINSGGQVVGTFVPAAGGNRAFLWEKGVMTDLGTLGGSSSSAYGINSAGQVVGTSTTAPFPQGEDRGFVWEKGAMTELGTLGGLRSYAWNINDAGQVVGSSETAAGESHATLWTRE
jgi:probable HAF family extracellular repeat protein